MRYLLLVTLFLEAGCGWPTWVRADTSEQTMTDDWRQCAAESDPGRKAEPSMTSLGAPLDVIRPVNTPGMQANAAERERQVRENQCMQRRGYKASSRPM